LYEVKADYCLSGKWDELATIISH